MCIHIFLFNLFFIVEFLKIDFRDKLQVQYALGHQSRGLELYTQDSDLDQLDMRTTITQDHYPIHSNNINSEDKKKLIERLRYTIEGHPDVRKFIFFTKL